MKNLAAELRDSSQHLPFGEIERGLGSRIFYFCNSPSTKKKISDEQTIFIDL